MTRRYAALRAIELLSGNEENREICEALQKVAESKLTRDWDSELVMEVLEDYIRENGYFPGLREMDRDPNMPKHSSLAMAMGMNYTDIKKTYFPDVPTKAEVERVEPEEWCRRFKVIFDDMGKPATEREFNRKKTSYMLHSTTWIRRTGSKTWSDLLRRCGLEDYIRSERNLHCGLTVSTNESDLSADEYDRVEEGLMKILA